MQPFAHPHRVGVRLTCAMHNRRWVWDGVTFVPDLHYYGLDGLDENLDAVQSKVESTPQSENA